MKQKGLFIKKEIVPEFAWGMFPSTRFEKVGKESRKIFHLTYFKTHVLHFCISNNDLFKFYSVCNFSLCNEFCLLLILNTSLSWGT